MSGEQHKYWLATKCAFIYTSIYGHAHARYTLLVRWNVDPNHVQTHWKLDWPIISKLVLLYVSHTWRVVLSLMFDRQCRSVWLSELNFDLSSAEASWAWFYGDCVTARSLCENFDCEQWARPVWRHRTEKVPPKERKNRINRYKIKCLKCTTNVVIYSRIKRRANYLSRILKS